MEHTPELFSRKDYVLAEWRVGLLTKTKSKALSENKFTQQTESLLPHILFWKLKPA